jgi:hypothetical protein
MRSELNAFKQLSLLQAADASRTSKEIMQKRVVRMLKLRIAEMKTMIEVRPKKK